MYKIYKIIDNTNGNIYIGITTKTLCDRLTAHRYDAKHNNSCRSKEIVKNQNYRMELIEETDDKLRETYWIKNTDCINKNIPGRTDAESKKLWSDNNKEYYKNYRENHKEKTKLYRKNNIEYFKEYEKKRGIMRQNWWSSMGGNPYYDNMSLLKIDVGLFY